MKVNEIFFSIQGESTYQGIPCVFIRLAGCNLRCRYCDTIYAYHEGTELSVEEVVAKVKRYKCRTVEITGGEPLLQRECPDLAARLLEFGYDVLVETNGTVDISQLDPRAVKIMDVKCPGSGHSHDIMWSNFEVLNEKDEIKFVISSQDDYVWARNIIEEKRLDERHIVLLSPAHGCIEPNELASWMLEDGISARLNLQIHKYIWKPDERGR
ncbi:MAG: radical SAM protein [Candidatus Glassbacteria bacterium]